MKPRNALALGLMMIAFTFLLSAGASAGGKKKAADRDRDGLPDRWEKRYKLGVSVKSAKRDPDRDSLSNLEEYRGRSNPRSDDTDGDGIEDGDENGVIVAFSDRGLLRVRMPDGHEYSGLVTSDTAIYCRAPEPEDSEDDSEHGDKPPVDKSDDVDDDADGDDSAPEGDDDAAEEHPDKRGVKVSNGGGHESDYCTQEAIQPGVEVSHSRVEDGYFEKLVLVIVGDSVPLEKEHKQAKT